MRGSAVYANVLGPRRRRTTTLKIFGHPMSTCTRKVIMTRAETSTPYELSERPTWQKTAGRA